nr:bifunctional 5,10-methylene-tetrahydrofolate dehydrogenase/5,10-methylene-tetrahydrofolate cyclohydrolase [Nitrospinaceae bacterium]NIR56553.1 bifunctional 5,10-methylene-tetrahydrofolate dehydrogenase/5,10-methylene-tetrahydrofolate cyclohydrolase [Nitrospinaceae bacterium]NIS87012.1 bifunctional 5,10-methylene-tetrahydrofolate dehydrogenase/5,10-methylene-tetrahydrofolate cyclohydrolase [Nitrospinaceae bacterium]NIT83854.1 bifunctional 5,10-methylene-tetrahydrofolate dehydrogenase/5,10-meth
MAIIQGKKVAEEIRSLVAREVETVQSQTGRVPGLATVLVGEDPASAVYVRNKNKTCRSLGLESFEQTLPADIPEADLLDRVRGLNRDPA